MGCTYVHKELYYSVTDKVPEPHEPCSKCGFMTDPSDMRWPEGVCRQCMKPSKSIIAAQIGIHHEEWKDNCHSISLAIVRKEIFPGGRVARGGCMGVQRQHSWIAIDNCYEESAAIIDPTLWCLRDDIDDIWVGTLADEQHFPKGHGNIWAWGRPPEAEEKEIKIGGTLSSEARAFLELCGPLDRKGWSILLGNAPVGGWPAKEIVIAASKNEELKALIPIDILGMLTDLNPGDLYLPR